MNKKKEHSKVVPELRFPEFENDGEWEQYILGEIAKFSKGKSVSKKDIVSDGKLLCIRYGELYTDYGEVIDEVISKTNLPKDELVLSMGNEVIVPSSGETQIDIARASCVLREGIALGGDLNIIKSKINGVFLSYYLNSSKKRAIAKMAQGVSVMHLYNSQLENLEIEIPKTNEQKKIANTLTTLDKLIAAENEKQDVLKVHKRGLLQQLFPAKGKKVPRVRFGEFVGDGDYEKKLLGDVFAYKNGKSNEGQVSKEGKFSLISLNSIDIEGNLKKDMKRVLNTDDSLKENDLVMVLSDVAHGYFLGLTCIIPNNNYVLNQRMAGLRANNLEEVDLEYIRLYINNNQGYFKSKGQGSSQQNLSKSAVTDCPLYLPPNVKEQKKIANCLSSLDDTIAAQSEKIDALKAHKKGLMQQLFPSINEVAK